ncbi:MAG: putative glycosyltransferase [Polyangiaceae bacterium]|jgi:GT2 family glycosyltransferase|nr:putative glycosyltransferase [Polyangiaceae bacterium]
MLLSVVVVNWNSRDHLAACLSSLEAQTHRELQVIVVDNGSVDGSAEMVATRFPSVTLVQTGANLGFAEGCNRGLAVAKGEWVAMLNNDAEAEPSWASALVSAAERAEPRVGSLQSLLLYRDRPQVVNSAGIGLEWDGSGVDLGEGTAPSDCAKPVEIFCPTAGAAAYRRSMLDRIVLEEGYFDRTYFMYMEDLDLGWRARLAGYTSLYVPESVVYHVWHGSSQRHGDRWLILQTRANRLRTVLKNGSGPFLASVSANLCKAGFELLRHGRLAGPGLLWAALRDGVIGRRQVSAASQVSRTTVEARWRPKSRRR